MLMNLQPIDECVAFRPDHPRIGDPGADSGGEGKSTETGGKIWHEEK